MAGMSSGVRAVLSFLAERLRLPDLTIPSCAGSPTVNPSAWRSRLHLPGCRPEPPRSGGARRRGLLLASLTCLSFLTVLAGTAAAQDVTFSSDSYRVNEGDAVTPELVLSYARSEAVTVYVQAMGFGRARGGEDFAAGPWDVTVPAGRTRHSFSIATFDDDKEEGNEQFLLHIAPYGHSPGVGRSRGGTPDAVVTITGKARISVPDARVRVREGGTAAIRVTIETPKPAAFTLDYTLSGTTASGADVTGGFGTRSITVPANAKRVEIPVGTVQDMVQGEDVEWFRVRLSTSASSVVFDSRDVQVGIVDDDTARISVPDARVQVQEGGTATVRIAIEHPKSTAFTLDYTLAGDTASAADVVGGFGARSITVPANAGHVDIPIGTVQDTVHSEDVEWFRVRMSTTASAVVFDTRDFRVGIVDDDTAALFASTASRTNERSHTHNVTVRLAPPPTSAITLNYTVDGTATPGSDYTALSSSVTVPAGKTTATIPVAIRDDSLPEGEETVVLTLAGGSGYQVGDPGTHTLTIAASDLPPVPMVEFDPPHTPASDIVSEPGNRMSGWVDEDAGTHAVKLRLSSAYPLDITVNYWVAHMTATPGSDYEPLSGKVTVPAGATTAAIQVTIIDDDDQEGRERFYLSLADGTGYSLRRSDLYTARQLFIRDNERLPVVAFSSSEAWLGEDAGTHNVKLTLSPAPNKNITVKYLVDRSRHFWWVPSATSGSDHEPLSGKIEILKGATTATIPVTIIDDGAHEGYEQLLLRLRSGAGYEWTYSSHYYHQVLINDDDPQIEVSFAAASQRVVEGAGTRDVTVNLIPPPTADLTLNYRVGGTATAGSDYTALTGTVTVPKGATTATIPVTIIDDSTPEGEETVELTLMDIGGHRKVRLKNTHTLTVAASDGPPTTTAASFATASQSAGDESGTRNVTVNLNPPPASNITLKYTVGGTATPGSDYETLSGTLAVSAGAASATIPVTLLADNVQEDLETVVLTLAPGTGYELASPGIHTLTIGTVPTVSFPVPLAVTSESVGTYRVPVHLSPAPPSGIAVSYTVFGTATSGDDYQPLSGTLSVPAGAAKVSIPVAIIDDSVEDSGEWVKLRLTDKAGYTVGSEYGYFDLYITNHESDNLEGRVQAQLDAAVASDNSASANLWRRALAAVRDEAPPSGLARLTKADAQALAVASAGKDDFEQASLWGEIAEVIGSSVTDPPPPTPDPEVTIAADAASVTEGTAASFTLTADPVPTAPLDVTLTVAASGDYGITAGERTVTIPVTGSYTLTLATTGDEADEADGSVSVTVDAGDGYTVGATSSGTIAIADDDPSSPEIGIAADAASVTEGASASFTLTADPAPAAPLDVTLTVAASGDYGIESGERTVTIPVTGSYTLTLATTGDDTDEADGSVSATVDAGDGYTVGATSSGTVAITDDDPPVPEIGIAADAASVTEGTAASFTLTADPAPTAPLDVTVTVATSGDYGITAGERTVTIPVTGSYTLTLATTGDGADEADGSVSVTVDTGDGYTVGTASSGSVAIEDDDVPEIEVTAGAGVTEGGSASFVLTATPPPATALDVTVTIAASGDYGIAAGEQTVTIPTTGSYTLTLATTGDEADEADGSVSVTVDAGDGYTVGTASSGSVIIADDDAPGSVLPAGHPVMKYASLVKTFYDRITARHVHGDSASGGWNKRFLKAMGHPDYADYPQAAVTVADATRLWNHGGPGANTAWNGTVDAVTYAEQYFAGTVTPPPTPDPEVTIAAGAGITEGTAASFVLTADPVPAAALDVTVTIAASGDYGITAGERTVTIPVTGAYTLTLTTDDDGTDESNGSVSATVAAGTGYTVGTPSSGTVAIADDDLPVPEMALAAGADVTEGTAASFVLTAAPPPAAPLGVTVTIATSGDYGITAGERTVTIPTTGSYTLTLATDNDGTDEPNGSVTATVQAGTGYTVGTASSGTVAIADDDLPPPAVSVAAGSGIVEGGDAVFTVTADRAPDANLSVALTVSEAQGSDFVAAADEGAKTVTIPAGKTSATLTVKTEDDTVDEPDGSVTATVAAGTGYTVGSASSGTVAVADNDAAASVLPVLSVESRSVQEGNGKVIVWATIDPFPSKAAFPEFHRTTRLKLRTIEGTAWDGVDYVGIPAYFGITEACNFHTTLAPNGKHGCRIDEVTILDDSHDDGGETFQLEVGFADSEPAPLRGLGAARGTVTIENSDPLPGAWLARFGRAVAEQALDGITARMAAPRTPGLQGTIAGQALDFGETAADGSDLSQSPGSPAFAGAGSSGAGFGEETQARSRTMTMQEVLRGSSFSLTGEADGAGGTLAFWGGTPGAGGLVSGSQFAGNQRGDGTAVHLSGETSAALLGTDYAQGPWLVGFALSQSRAEGSYASEGGSGCSGLPEAACAVAARAGDGEVEASLTATIPYAALAVSERLKLWGAAGHGSGDVTVKTALGGSLSADTAWSMAAAGLRGDLLAPSAEGTGPSLALVSDALWVRTSSEKTRDLAASESDVSRLRLGLEGSWGLALAGGGNIVPKLELGARHDGGDAETGFGVELGGGLAWRDPGLGLTLDLSGRTLVAHDDGGLEDRGISAQLTFDPEPSSGRGLSLGLGQDWGGRSAGGLDALFAPEPLEDREGSSEAAARWTAEAAWGFPALGGRFTGSPHVGLGLATDGRDYSLGWRLTPEAANAPDLSFGLKATRRESGGSVPEHILGVEASVQW